MNNVEIRDGSAFISINPKIYGLEIVFSASYLFTDDYYIVIDGNTQEELLVEIRPKKSSDLEKAASDFNNELVNYAAYATQLARTFHTRQAVLHRVMKPGVTIRQNRGSSVLLESKPWRGSI
ncbi:MAG TPA: hypothetical protein VJB12_04395 [Candidatus Nanoarchaeia archaeon]|nr:hypothetical protein [Candidatus Nanoarchaeia archaeon]